MKHIFEFITLNKKIKPVKTKKINNKKQLIKELINKVDSEGYCICSGLDISGLTDLSDVFYKVNKSSEIKYLDVSDLDVSNVKNFDGLFYNCQKLKTIAGLCKWHFKNAENLNNMFYRCWALEDVDINWGEICYANKLESAENMFSNCKSLKNDFSDLELPESITKYERNHKKMFYGCTSLENTPEWYYNN